MRKQDASGVWHSGIPSWAELGRMAQAGTINQVLSEGDLIPIRLANGEENAIQVTHDLRGNMFFVFESCLEKQAPMSDTPKSLSDWAQSRMQKCLNEEVFPLLPAELQAAIQPIQIKQEMQDGTICTAQSKLFLLSEEQVFGKCKFSKPEEGVSQLKTFEGLDERKIKRRNGIPSWWWLRSSFNYFNYFNYSGFNNSVDFVNVTPSGDISFFFASSDGSVVPAFCLIDPKK